MSQERTTLLLIKGAISMCPPEQQAKINTATEEIRAILAKYPEGEGNLALGLIGAELAAQG